MKFTEPVKECLPELCWGSMWLSVGRQAVHKAGESQWVRIAWPKNHAQGDRERWKMGGEGEGEQRGKGRVDMNTGKQAVRLEEKQKRRRIPTGEKKKIQEGEWGKVKTLLTSQMSQTKHNETPQNNQSPVQKRQDVER